MERDSLGIRLRDLPLMTLAISTRTPQQALAALEPARLQRER